MSRLPRGAGALACGLLVALLAGAPVRAQGARPVPAEGSHAFADHDREQPRPLPPVLVGVGQAGNDFLAPTPGLQRSDRAIALVDREAAHERRMRMLVSGATYHRPLPVDARVRPTREGWVEAPSPPRRAGPPPPAKAEVGGGPGGSPLVRGALVLLLVASLLLRALRTV